MNRKYFNETHVNDVLLDEFEDNLKTFIKTIYKKIRSYTLVKSKYEHVFNICTINKNGAAISRDLTAYLRKYEIVFKINFSAGHVVQQLNKQFRFLSPHEENYQQLEEAHYVAGDDDLDNFFKEFQKCELYDKEKFKLTSTKSHHIVMTNITFFIYPIPQRALLNGAPPSHLGRWGPMKSVYCLKRNNDNQDITDNLCAFRALALFLKQIEIPRFTASHINNDHVHCLYREFRHARAPLLPEDPLHFEGTYLPTLKQLCLYKEVNVVVFSTQDVALGEIWDYDEPCMFEFQGEPTCNLSRIIYKFDAGFQHTMHLIDYQNHCMLIKKGKVNVVLKQYAFRKCSYVTNRRDHLNAHEKICTKIRKLKYRTGVYEGTQPLFLQSKELGFEFPEGYESYPYQVVWDIETALSPNRYIPQTRKEALKSSQKTSLKKAIPFIQPIILY